MVGRTDDAKLEVILKVGLLRKTSAGGFVYIVGICSSTADPDGVDCGATPSAEPLDGTHTKEVRMERR